MDLDRLKALIDLVSDAGIAELEMVEGDRRIRIVAAASKGNEPSVSITRTDPSPVSGPITDLSSGAGLEKSDDGSVVRSPAYGLLHLAPAPGAAPFVAAGDTIEKGQALCMIESMKVFSTVAADRAGKIAAVLVESGSEVEYGQPLFRIE
jgi:acetyl-CoA carboxylase biotin carboxyl carrier protein